MNAAALLAMLVSLLGSLLLGGVFLAAALPKLGNPRGFALTVVEYRVLPLGPSRLYARIVPPLELLASLLLLGGIAVRLAAAILALLLASFSGAVVANLVRGRELDCGCFGGSANSTTRATSRQVSLGVLLQDLALLIVALLVFITAQPDLALALWSFVRLVGSSSALAPLALLACVVAAGGISLALGRTKRGATPGIKPGIKPGARLRVRPRGAWGTRPSPGEDVPHLDRIGPG